MGALVDSLVHEISIHASAEERFVYPLFRERMGEIGRALHERSLVDDNINKEVLSLLEKLEPMRDGYVWKQTVEKLRYNELDHMSIEEGWFEQLRPHLSMTELEAMEDQLIAARSTAPTHPHALGPLTAKFMHPIAAVVDRVKDKFAGTAHQPTPPVDINPSSTYATGTTTTTAPPFSTTRTVL